MKASEQSFNAAKGYKSAPAPKTSKIENKIHINYIFRYLDPTMPMLERRLYSGHAERPTLFGCLLDNAHTTLLPLRLCLVQHIGLRDSGSSRAPEYRDQLAPA